MLQILSGKFFTENDDVKRFEQKDIYYSNAILMEIIENNCIETDIGSVEIIKSNPMVDIASYYFKLNGFSYSNDHATDYSIASNQFKILLSFWFKAIFDYEKTNLEKICRNHIKTPYDEVIPSKILPEYFNASKACFDIEEFVEFVNKILKLSRNDYKAVLNSLTSFYQALTAIDYNLELAYSLFVFSIESLDQEYDGFEESWDYYNEDIKKALDEIIDKYDVPNDEYVNLQNIILESEKQKLSSRFKNFSMNNINDKFFKEESEDLKNPLKKSDLEIALDNTYNIRSRYVHSLKNFNKYEKMFLGKNIGEVIYTEDGPILTINALARLTHHILYNFINELNICEDIEEINVEEELQHRFTMPASPEYWITDPNYYERNSIMKYFYDFLELFNKFRKKENLSALKDLIMRIEKELKQDMKEPIKRLNVSFYYLCNKLYDEDGLSENFNHMYEKRNFNSVLNTLSVETLITKLIRAL